MLGRFILLLAFLSLARLSSGLASLNSRASKDQIKSLPGLGSFPSRMFSGYLSAAPNRHLHYWHIESQGNPNTDPLVVWFNGGPGCSSLTGLFTELGALHVAQDGGTVFQNPFAWSKVGNMLYLEGPTGVGFSYSDNFQDDVTNDTRTCWDFTRAINDFIANVRPDYKTRDLFLSGESYAGVYIPLTATYILRGMKAGTFSGRLAGIAIGNGILSERHQHNSVVDFLHFHGAIGTQLWNRLKAACCPNSCTAQCDFYSHLKILYKKGHGSGNDWVSDGSACGNLSFLASEQMLWYTENDPYNIYQDCYSTTTLAMARQRAHRYWRHHYSVVKERQSAAAKGQMFTSVTTPVPASFSALFNSDSTDANSGFACWGFSSRSHYLNRADVQAALHIPSAVTSNARWKAQNGWGGCSSFVGRNYNRTETEMDPWFQGLLRSQIRILIYNGDVDMVCNFLGDEWFMDAQIAQLPIRVSAGPRGPWYYRGAIAGYVHSWTQADVLTVKGAGHFVPTDRPGPALQMIANFLRQTRNYSTATGPLISRPPTSAPSSAALLSLSWLALSLFLFAPIAHSLGG